jgi:ferredoxin-NADP reductase
VFFHIDVNGETICRKYTPVSPVNEKGTVKFVIKIYRKCEEFPNGGKITPILEQLQPGDKVKMEGPKGFLNY